jgi:hypothetical protein
LNVCLYVWDKLCDTCPLLLREVELHVRSMPMRGQHVKLVLTFETCQATLGWVSLVCYEFYVLDQARYFQGTEGRVRGSQRRHSQRPSSPFCDYSSHPWAGTQAACTTSWICTQWKGASCTHLGKIRNPPASPNHP